jgi:intracellular septation protein A
VIWTYRRPFRVGGQAYRVEARFGLQSLRSRLYRDERLVDEQSLLFAAGYRNLCHRLPAAAGVGELRVEVGYVSLWSLAIRVEHDGELCHESHPGRDIHYMETHPMWSRMPAQDPEEARAQAERWRRNKPSILADLGLGLLFFILGKLTGDLTVAALGGAAAGLGLVLAQRFVKVDLLGGFAVFGTIMLLVSALFSLAFQSEYMVQMKSSVLGVGTAILFLGDGLLRGGAYFGERMQRYMPAEVHTGRMALGLGLLGLAMAAANYAVATWLSEDFWLTYTTFLDMPLSIALAYAVYFWARAGVPAATENA